MYINIYKFIVSYSNTKNVESQYINSRIHNFQVPFIDATKYHKPVFKKQQKFNYRSSGASEIQDQSAGGFGIW